MKINVSKEAAQWYQENMDLQKGDALRFYGKVYGSSSGFSLAVMKLEPTRPYASQEVDGITYYIEHGDAWYFEDKDLTITLGEKYSEPHYELS
ncbi:hypothetical protein AOC36_10725 [Erysipelothrix larvae]|uniref:HesB/YadR/YfhF family protein n=1 Tax=Erysipelothrix larvae TaxID=1514105 RepID=A0A109UHL7_9FIRM|nr:hypothetical protein [Erysipelothrix larvae]AMC94428.1 hypothetical protein AOC36_10725 [Erysipelothrix larvae]